MEADKNSKNVVVQIVTFYKENIWNAKPQKMPKTALAAMTGVQEKVFAANVYLIIAANKKFRAAFFLSMQKKAGTGQ